MIIIMNKFALFCHVIDQSLEDMVEENVKIEMSIIYARWRTRQTNMNVFTWFDIAALSLCSAF